jgi:hypothetical protein
MPKYVKLIRLYADCGIYTFYHSLFVGGPLVNFVRYVDALKFHSSIQISPMFILKGWANQYNSRCL